MESQTKVDANRPNECAETSGETIHDGTLEREERIPAREERLEEAVTGRVRGTEEASETDERSSRGTVQHGVGRSRSEQRARDR